MKERQKKKILLKIYEEKSGKKIGFLKKFIIISLYDIDTLVSFFSMLDERKEK